MSGMIRAQNAAVSAFLPGYTTTVKRTVQAKLRDIADVRDWGAKPNSGNDDTSAWQRAINELSGNSTDSTFGSGNYGLLSVPPGMHALSTVILRSGIQIRGQGSGQTIITPAGGTPYVFDMGGVSDTQLAAHLGLSGMYIATNGQTATDPSFARVTTGGIRLQYIERNAVLHDVKIAHLNGTLLYMQNVQDLDVYGAEFKFGVDHIVIDADTVNPCNSIRFHGGRSEGADDRLLKINPAAGALPPRQIKFVSTKFEVHGGSNYTDSTPDIDLGYVENVAFIGCELVPSSTTKAMIRIADGPSGAQPRGVAFVGCSSSVPTLNVSTLVDATGSGTYQVAIVTGGTYRGLKEYAFKGRVFVANNDFFECQTPIVAPDDYIPIGTNTYDALSTGPSGITQPLKRGEAERQTTIIADPVPANTVQVSNSGPIWVYGRVTLTPTSSIAPSAEPYISKDNVNWVPLGSIALPVNASAASIPLSFMVPAGYWWKIVTTSQVTIDHTKAYSMQ